MIVLVILSPKRLPKIFVGKEMDRFEERFDVAA